MRTLVLFLVAGLALGRPRDEEDRLHPEEIKQILGIEDEEVALQAGGHYVYPAHWMQRNVTSELGSVSTLVRWGLDFQQGWEMEVWATMGQ